MSTRKSKSEKEREKIIQDRLQILLTRMLQDEDNKYCVDCDAKGPRWASWNLGVYLCIRCAGIHRNLGVHISKVKSVNLDSWTPHQVASMQLIGNSRGRAIYEAQVSEDFRRPQTDSQLEVFIRAKYEKKKYIAREWVPQTPPEYPIGWDELIEAEKQKKDPRAVMLALHQPNPSTAKASERPISFEPKIPSESNPTDSSLSADLLGLTVSETFASTSTRTDFTTDLLGLNSNIAGQKPVDSNVNSSHADHGKTLNIKTEQQSKSENSLFDVDFNSGFTAPESETTKMSKDSILALFNQPSTHFSQQVAQAQQLPGFMSSFSLEKMNPPYTNFVSSSQSVSGANNFSSLTNPFLTSSSGHSVPNIQQTMDSQFGSVTSQSHFFH